MCTLKCAIIIRRKLSLLPEIALVLCLKYHEDFKTLFQSFHVMFVLLQVSLYKFVRQSGESLPPTLFVPYMKMLASLASCPAAAKQAYQLLKTNQPPQSNVAWDHFFSSLNRYGYLYILNGINLRQIYILKSLFCWVIGIFYTKKRL